MITLMNKKVKDVIDSNTKIINPKGIMASKSLLDEKLYQPEISNELFQILYAYSGFLIMSKSTCVAVVSMGYDIVSAAIVPNTNIALLFGYGYGYMFDMESLEIIKNLRTEI